MALTIVPPFKLLNSTTITPRSSSITTIEGNAGGLTIIGGTGSTDNITIQSTTNATKGSIRLDDKIILWPTYQSTISTSLDTILFNPSTTSINSGGNITVNYILNATPTYTIDAGLVTAMNGININPNITFNSTVAFIYTHASLLGTFTFAANPGFANSVTGLIIGPTVIGDVASVPPPNVVAYINNTNMAATANNIGTTGAVVGYQNNTVIRTTGATTTYIVTSSFGFRDTISLQANTSGGSTTLTNRFGILIETLATTTTGNVVLTNNIGYTFNNQPSTSGNFTATTIKAINLLQNTGTGGTTAWNIFSSGTAPSSMLGSLILGTNAAAASETLQVVGNTILGFPSVGTGILKFANATNSNIAAFQAGVSSSNTTYTLPLTDGTSNQVLSTNGSATLSWITPSGSGNTTTSTKFKGSDTSRTTATGNDPDLVSLTTATAKYMFEGWLWVVGSTTTPDIVINITVSTSTVTFFQISYVTYDAAGGAGIDNNTLTSSGGNSPAIQVSVAGTFIKLTGYLDLVNAGSLALQWQRNGASGTTTLKQGSWLRIMQL